MRAACVRLGHRQPVAQGKWRLVYEHPDDPKLLIKVARSDTAARFAAESSPPFRSLHRYYIGPIALAREVAEYRRMRSAPPTERRFLQEYFGFVDTDFGPGLVVGAIRARSGELAATLERLIEERHDPVLWLDQLATFMEWFTSSPVVTRDLHARNLVHDAVNGHFVLIDGLGARNVIPLCAWFPARNRRRKARAARRMMEHVMAKLETHRGAGCPDLRAWAEPQRPFER